MRNQPAWPEAGSEVGADRGQTESGGGDALRGGGAANGIAVGGERILAEDVRAVFEVMRTGFQGRPIGAGERGVEVGKHAGGLAVEDLPQLPPQGLGQEGGGRRSWADELSLHAAAEFTEAHGLDEKLVHAGGEGARAVLGVAVGADADDAQTGRAVAAQAAGDGEAVELRHGEIEHGDIGRGPGWRGRRPHRRRRRRRRLPGWRATRWA